MQLDAIIARMETFPAALRALVGGLSRDDASWRPPAGGWSVVEIVNHLADEEHEDFRHRVGSTLEDPDAPWPPIDPKGAVSERSYNERDLDESLDRFAKERMRSVNWLRSLGSSPPWTQTYTHPKIGDLRAGDVMASFAAHDALHLRQVARRLFDLTERDTSGWSTAYAGPWPDKA